MRYMLWCDDCNRQLESSNVDRKYLENAERIHKTFHKGHHTRIGRKL